MTATPPAASGAAAAPSGSRPAAPRAGLVNFTGNWLMDVGASDSLDPLLAYHGFAVAAGAAAVPNSSVKANWPARP